MTNKPYHIVCVSDENYVQHAAVMLCSLFENNRGKQFHVYLFTTGIEANTQERLEDCAGNTTQN